MKKKFAALTSKIFGRASGTDYQTVAEAEPAAEDARDAVLDSPAIDISGFGHTPTFMDHARGALEYSGRALNSPEYLATISEISDLSRGLEGIPRNTDLTERINKGERELAGTLRAQPAVVSDQRTLSGLLDGVKNMDETSIPTKTKEAIEAATTKLNASSDYLSKPDGFVRDVVTSLDDLSTGIRAHQQKRMQENMAKHPSGTDQAFSAMSTTGEALGKGGRVTALGMAATGVGIPLAAVTATAASVTETVLTAPKKVKDLVDKATTGALDATIRDLGNTTPLPKSMTSAMADKIATFSDGPEDISESEFAPLRDTGDSQYSLSAAKTTGVSMGLSATAQATKLMDPTGLGAMAVGTVKDAHDLATRAYTASRQEEQTLAREEREMVDISDFSQRITDTRTRVQMIQTDFTGYQSLADDDMPDLEPIADEVEHRSPPASALSAPASRPQARSSAQEIDFLTGDGKPRDPAPSPSSSPEELDAAMRSLGSSSVVTPVSVDNSYSRTATAPTPSKGTAKGAGQEADIAE